MVLPEKGTSWLFNNDGRNFQEKMIEYIKLNFSDILGEDIHLLEQPNGLDLLQEKIAEKYGKSGKDKKTFSLSDFLKRSAAAL